jgi:uncharacterized protein YjbI with pentapeptide repeats
VLFRSDFSRADLRGANLHGLDPSRARWEGADLSHVRRTDADLLAAERWHSPLRRPK